MALFEESPPSSHGKNLTLSEGRSSEVKKARRLIITLTDGVWSNQSLAIDQASACIEQGCESVAIGFGSANEAFLKQLSSSNDLGIFIDQSALSDTFSTIAQVLVESGDQPLNLKYSLC